ncbi:BRO family protein [Sphingomonas sp. gentR]|uniref:BRO family protein n=1 Tax=unclassified Sphingomonas TaxID=196159 RepID=UPI00097280BA|nr:BRO family protein [Sphingomonas sp. LK11]APX65015.1 hypothetical protein AV944_03240 [Sphingomonas sp. LK11]
MKVAPAPRPASFHFDGHDLRYILLNADPWFVAADVCRCLGLSLQSGTYGHVSRLDEDEKQLLRRPRSLDPQSDLGAIFGKMERSLTLIAESGLYKLALRADSFRAKPFQTWVTRDVLPSIRKTGSYSIAKVPHQEVLPAAVQPYQLPATLSEALRAYADEVERREESERTTKLLEAAREADRPKVEFAEKYASAEGAFSPSDVARTFGFSSGKAFCQFLWDRKIFFHNARGENIAKAEHRTAGRFVQWTTIGADKALRVERLF